MPYEPQCPACKRINPPHKVVEDVDSPFDHECRKCGAQFNRFTYVYLEDPTADEDDELFEYADEYGDSMESGNPDLDDISGGRP